MSLGYFKIGPFESLNDQIVANVPEIESVYALWQGDLLIYIGKSDCSTESNLRVMLNRHLQGEECACSSQASHFMYIPSLDSQGDRDFLIDRFVQSYGVKPIGNRDDLRHPAQPIRLDLASRVRQAFI